MQLLGIDGDREAHAGKRQLNATLPIIYSLLQRGNRRQLSLAQWYCSLLWHFPDGRSRV
jgi:hypothetical protein